jgi:DNA polymerase
VKSQILEKVKQCRNCLTLGGKHVPASGSPTAKVAIVTGPPGTREAEEKHLLAGPVGEAFDLFLDEAGLTRNDLYITSVLKCQPPGNREAHEEELDMCASTWLRREIEIVSPKMLVVLGKTAHEAMLGDRVPFKHGRVLKTSKRVYLVMRHPAYFLQAGRIEEFILYGSTFKALMLENCADG